VKSLSAVAFAVVGVLVLVGALRALEFALLVSFTDQGSPAPHAVLVISWLTFAATVAIGLLVIFTRRALAARWFADSSSVIAVEPNIALRLTVIIVGVVLIASAVPGLIGAFANGVIQSSDDSTGLTTSVSWDWVTIAVSAVTPFAQLVVGLLLLGFSRPLARRLWPGGTSGTSEPEPLAPASQVHEAAVGPADHPGDVSS